ncbi:MAG TPA: YggT family protein [Nitratifractor salsuginis]|uniref:YggT family protein n=1 Tax=Nitratifractor salsuginis TaxID=269261 RepID=A0A7V2WL39_9BACT|nr:YggT family protein [Nitratifractor sp.]HFC03405.1 YggT family protein [Nitratifractor salsuginis]
MSALIYALVQVIHTVINLYIWMIIIAAVLSFVQPNPSNPTVRSLILGLYRLTEPAFAWVRRKMPFVVVGGIDLSPIVILLALQFLDIFLLRLVFG